MEKTEIELLKEQNNLLNDQNKMLIQYLKTLREQITYTRTYYTVRELVSLELQSLSFPVNFAGYDMIEEAICMIVENKDFLFKVKENLYVVLAEKFHTSQKCVDKNIQTIIETCRKRLPKEVKEDYLGKYASFTTIEVMAKVAYKVKNKYEKQQNQTKSKQLS